MPWNDNANPGPWGTPPSSNDDEPRLKPRRQPPSPPPSPPAGPDFAEVLRRARDEWSRLTRGRRADRLFGRLAGFAAAGVVTLWILSGFYVVQPYEQAVVSRLGAFDRTEGPGLRFHWPTPIERVERVDVGHDQKLVVGGDAAAGPAGEGLTPTADGNLVAVGFSVDYRIIDPVRWLYRVRDPDLAVRSAAERVMREALGARTLSAALAPDHGQVEAEALARLRSILAGDHLGIAVDSVRVQSVAPPAQVAGAWQDAGRAGQDAQAAVDSANAYASKTTGDAQAQAGKITQAADAYQQQVVHEANGEASRFDQILAEYRQAPSVTRERLYLQTMEDVLSHAHTVIIGARDARIVLAPPQAPPAGPPAAAPSHGSEP